MKGFIQEWVTRSAAKHPAARAIVTEHESVSYAELDFRSATLATALRARGCERRDRVAVLVPKSARAITSFIGILKAGCTYVPLDPRNPAARTASILRRSAPRILLVSNDEPSARALRDLDALRALAGVQVVRLESLAMEDDIPFKGDEPAEDRAVGGACLQDPAYILFTSGSTGEPKGVPISHANVRPLVEWALEWFDLGPRDRLSGHASLTFDLSTLDIYAAFAAGAELHPVPDHLSLLPHRLVEFIQRRGLTFWFSVPAQLAYVSRFDALPEGGVPSLRHVAWCGDALSPSVLGYWRRRLPGVAFSNLYGPTETTVASSCYRVPDDFDEGARDIPIGRALPGEKLLVLDSRLRPVADGETGDLWIGGAGLSAGYWRDPDRTRHAFVPDPTTDDPSARIYRTGDVARRDAAGDLHFLGRSDFQIKTAGYRVEPGEVEHALLGVPGVVDCAVVPVPTNGFEGTSIGCAYVSSERSVSVEPHAVRSALAGQLPSYMIPTRWMALDELPVGPRGKVDRSRIRDLFVGGGVS